MSRRLSTQLKNTSSNKPKPKVKFPDDLIFLESIKDNDIDCVKNMLRRASVNIDINKISDSGLTALHQAVLENSLDLTRILVESKADINAIDEDSWTPLHAAASMGYYEVTKYLLENGADSNALTAENERPIDLVDQSDFPLISLLLNYMRVDDEPNCLNEDKAYNFIQNDTDVYQRLFLNILRTKPDNESIIKEIENSVENDEKFLNSNVFIKALTMSICEYGLNKNDLNKTELKLKLNLLAMYIDKNHEFEMECLNAVYEFIEKNDFSSDLFKKYVLCFNESKIISNSLYQSWKNQDTNNLDKKKYNFVLKN